MNATTDAHAKPRSTWIISPAWDMLYLVATPLLVIPLVSALSHRWFSPEQISLVVISFASVGHHLPGFMRCYGDRDLFVRFRWRFLLVPPFLLGLSLAFAWQDLHGLQLMALLWATWHGMMQVYGFMRIYDLKRGVRDRLTAKLDFFCCLSIFAAGFVFSDARVYAIMEMAWLSGVPAADPIWLIGVRWAVGLATVFALAAFVLRAVWSARRGNGVNWLKLLFAATTGFLYWSTGTLTTNMLVGVAMFEICHALQYNAIVWTYNRRLAERAGERFGPLGFLFRDRFVFLGLYVAAILAFGSINLLNSAVHDATTQRILIAVLSTSALLHFYYDGFIWKVRERKTQANLDIDSASSPLQWNVPALVHAGKWLVFFAIAVGLFELERRGTTRDDGQQRLASLIAWTPDVPELQMRQACIARVRGDTDEAVRLARAALARRPRSYAAHAEFGNALRQAGQFEKAAKHLQIAVSLAPDKGENHFDLALTLVAQGRWTEADRWLAEAQRLRSEPAASIREKWIAAHLRQAAEHYNAGDVEQAAAYYRRAIECEATNVEALNGLAAALWELGRTSDARAVFFRALQADSNHAITHYNLSHLLREQGEIDQANFHVRRALELGYKPQI